VIKLRELSAEEKAFFLREAREKARRDQIWFEQSAREESREEGEAKARLSLARNLLNMNFPVEKIVEATGLSAAEIETLRPH
jgi:predicted transposase/invertase (TIGR01784 family)